MKRRHLAVAVALFWLLAYNMALAQIEITFPTTRAIFQRNNSNQATIYVAGNYTQFVDQIQARFTPMQTGQGTATAWTTIQSNPQGGVFRGIITGAGGWYLLEVRGLKNNVQVGSIASVQRVGIGEVFVVSGQSNASGDSSSPLAPAATDDRVNSVNFQNLSTNADGSFKLYGYGETVLPVPAYVHLDAAVKIAPFGNQVWSWGLLGDFLVSRLNVPIMFFNSAWGGTIVGNWSESTDSTATTFYLRSFPKGMPYGHLRLSLNYYANILGVRSVLWHQGESDNVDNTTQANYVSRLNTVIQKSREHSNKSSLAWIIARVSYFEGTIDANVINAQNQVISQGQFLLSGPQTDAINGPGNRDAIDVHFEGNGHVLHASGWNNSMPNQFFTSQNTPYNPATLPLLTTSCLGNIFTLSVPSGSASYKWSNGATTNSIVPTGPGAYYVKIKDNTDNTVLSQTVNITNTTASATPSSNTPVSTGSTVQLSVTDAASYAWAGPSSFTNTSQNPVISNATTAHSGTYSVTITNIYGCSASATTSVTVNSPLPVELVYFNGQANENQSITLTWETASEHNSSHFLLERSRDLSDFQTLAKIFAAGNSSAFKIYRFTDEVPLFGTNYYRLRQVDLDGTAHLYRPVAIDIADNQEITIFPNPTDGQSFSVQGRLLGHVQMHTLTGHEVALQIHSESEIIEVRPVTKLNAGMYVLTIQAGEKTERRKLMVR